MKLAAVIIISYLLGSIPWGVIAGKVTKGVDIREYGSGKMGATNVLRTLGLKVALVVILADVAKGVLAVVIAWILMKTYYAQVAAAVAAVAGHNWSVFIRFQGGRGVSVALGGLLTMAPLGAALGLALGIAVIGLSRYASLGSMTGAVAASVIMASLWATDREPPEYVIYTLLVTILILFQHRDNMKRLLAGTERKVGQKAEKRQSPSTGDK